MSSHLTNIPEAVRIAASLDPSIDPSVKQQAVEYLTKVRELCEETWQVGSSSLISLHKDLLDKPKGKKGCADQN
jgi:exportin-T